MLFVKIQRIYPENFSKPLNKLYPGGYVAGPWFEEPTLAWAYSDEHIENRKKDKISERRIFAKLFLYININSF